MSWLYSLTANELLLGENIPNPNENLNIYYLNMRATIIQIIAAQRMLLSYRIPLPEGKQPSATFSTPGSPEAKRWQQYNAQINLHVKPIIAGKSKADTTQLSVNCTIKTQKIMLQGTVSPEDPVANILEEHWAFIKQHDIEELKMSLNKKKLYLQKNLAHRGVIIPELEELSLSDQDRLDKIFSAFDLSNTCDILHYLTKLIWIYDADSDTLQTTSVSSENISTVFIAQQTSQVDNAIQIEGLKLITSVKQNSVLFQISDMLIINTLLERYSFYKEQPQLTETDAKLAVENLITRTGFNWQLRVAYHNAKPHYSLELNSLQFYAKTWQEGEEQCRRLLNKKIGVAGIKPKIEGSFRNFGINSSVLTIDIQIFNPLEIYRIAYIETATATLANVIQLNQVTPIYQQNISHASAVRDMHESIAATVLLLLNHPAQAKPFAVNNQVLPKVSLSPACGLIITFHSSQTVYAAALFEQLKAAGLRSVSLHDAVNLTIREHKAVKYFLQNICNYTINYIEDYYIKNGMQDVFINEVLQTNTIALTNQSIVIPNKINASWLTQLICPISKAPYSVPYITIYGDTFNEPVIMSHIAVNQTCPLSGRPLKFNAQEREVIENKTVRMIVEYYEAMSDQDQIPFPQHLFMCPITNKPIANPVLAIDGITYERSSIEIYLHEHNNQTPTGFMQANNFPLIENQLFIQIQLAYNNFSKQHIAPQSVLGIQPASPVPIPAATNNATSTIFAPATVQEQPNHQLSFIQRFHIEQAILEVKNNLDTRSKQVNKFNFIASSDPAKASALKALADGINELITLGKKYTVSDLDQAITILETALQPSETNSLTKQRGLLPRPVANYMKSFISSEPTLTDTEKLLHDCLKNLRKLKSELEPKQINTQTVTSAQPFSSVLKKT